MSVLANWMTKSGATDDTVAAAVGVSRVQISRIRRGLSRPSAQLAEKLSEHTGVAAWDFLKPEPEQTREEAA